MKYNKLVLLCIIIIFLSGCGTKRTITKIEPVDIYHAPETYYTPTEILRAIHDGQFLEMEKLITELPDSVKIQPIIFHCLGAINFYKNNLCSSENYLLEALEAYTDTVGKAEVSHLLSEVYQLQKDYRKSAEYLKLYLNYNSPPDENINEKIQFFDILSSREVKQIVSDTTRTVINMSWSRIVPKIDVAILKEEPLWFLLDTGCNFDLIVSSEIAEKYNIIPIPGINGKGTIISGKKIDSKLALLDSLIIGDFVVRNIPTIIWDKEHLRWEFLGLTIVKVDGIIGTPLLREFKTTFDFKHKQVIFERYNELLLKTSEEQNIYISNNHIFVKASINNQHGFNLLIDTGATSSMLTSNGVNKLVVSPDELNKVNLTFFVDDGIYREKAKELKNLCIGIDRYNICGFDLFIRAFEYANDGILGNDVLRNFKFTFDFQAMKLILAPYEKEKTK